MTKRDLGEGIAFIRYRRITGFLGELHSMNNAKQNEVKDRVKHNTDILKEVQA